ncbi:hypothetical protein WN944_022216 [Citrus x changshan-huyou]|uniref:Uncharacterized protein n=1 Tax=Citrus x changshan-huyou TaxID=2935761 RepID=A0AAP0QVY8_9ROSI
MRFEVHGHLRSKIVWALLRPKTDNILSGLGWVMIDGIRAAPRILLSDGATNLNENVESLRKGVCCTLIESHIGKASGWVCGFVDTIAIPTAGMPNLSDYFPVLKILDLDGIRRCITSYSNWMLELVDRLTDQHLKDWHDFKYAGMGIGGNTSQSRGISPRNLQIAHRNSLITPSLSMECSAYIHGRSLKMSFIESTMEIVTEPYTRLYREQDNTFSHTKPSLQDSGIKNELAPKNRPLYLV